MRQAMLALPDDHPAAPVTRELDFYTLSGVRDALAQTLDLAGYRTGSMNETLSDGDRRAAVEGSPSEEAVDGAAQ